MSALVEYKCPCCGGAIEFNSNSQKMKCPYCDTEFEIEALKEFTEASQSEGDSLDWDCPDSRWGASEAAGMNVYTCKKLRRSDCYRPNHSCLGLSLLRQSHSYDGTV